MEKKEEPVSTLEYGFLSDGPPKTVSGSSHLLDENLDVRNDDSGITADTRPVSPYTRALATVY